MHAAKHKRLNVLHGMIALWRAMTRLPRSLRSTRAGVAAIVIGLDRD